MASLTTTADKPWNQGRLRLLRKYLLSAHFLIYILQRKVTSDGDCYVVQLQQHVLEVENLMNEVYEKARKLKNEGLDFDLFAILFTVWV